ncbi:RHS repeat-associated core domain-containing protein [Pseudoalteromonas carrageenovora]|uniref:RHS repeat-associated core domain-containing protein n=1 Tax=Pseudoalteromonas carrageenovora TaxID=227 RepID=UPI0026E3792E|nr:RHS repeat-associated core domain-containing protein [Pseudoalteromonas carrageenovora]MDO6834626.1 RHS repeat-associated core domain-containing protein [Pseudoalteromonas carrageenovora]
MQSNTVVLQGTSYPICLVAGSAKAPAGYEAVVTNTNESANRLVDQVSETLTSDPSKRIDTINLLISIGIEASKADDQRKTANSLIKAIAAGTIKCFREKVKYSIQVSDNTNSSSEDENSNKKTKTTASGKSASQAPVKNTGGASNSTASEESITNQECRSDPVSMLSGEEILPLIDFTLAGSRQLVWRRLYRSSHADVCTTMGNGWRHDFMASLTEHYLPPPKVGPKQKGTYWLEYQDEHGAKHKFEKVKPGQSSYQLSSNLALHYQTNGKQVLVTPDDQHLTFKPGESAWLLEKIINEKGQSIAFYYDAKERLHRIEVNKVRGCIISYNAQGLLSKIAAYCTDKNNKQQLLSPLLASYEYDENKNLVQSTNQQNETERYAYNAANLLTKRTRASGFSHHFEWDSYSPSAKCIKQWGDNNTYTYQFEYNLERGETTCIDSRGHKEHFVHNAQGKLVKHTDPNGNVWQYTYNAQGQKLSEIKPDSSTTRYSYTPYGQLETITQPDGSQTHFAYNQLGQRVLTTLPDGQTITRKYSVAGLLQSETFGDGRTTLYSYDKLGQLTQHINKNGQITKFIWNEQGELLAKHHNDELIRYSYDSLGRVNATLNNAGLLTQYKYNEHGQLTQTIAFDENEPENKQHQYFSYDEAGRLISSQNSKGDTTEQHFEGLSQPHCVIQPDGSALHLTYDKERNLTAIERSDGHVYRISYDANENPTQITGFDGTLQQYKYDACNRLASVTQSNKRHVKIERDSLGRVTAQHASLASDSHIINNANYYSYTKQGKIARAHNAQSTLKQRFDKGGRLLCAEQVNNQQQAHTLKYSYDEYGRRQTLTLPDSTTLKYSYNQFGQLSAINLLQTNSKEVELAKPLVTLSYDSQGNIQTQQFGNSITLTQQFDVFNRLTQQQLTHPAQALFDTCTYNYDSINQLIARKNEGVSSQNINFEYNSLGQLIKQTLASSGADTITNYLWDSFGNPQSQTVQSNTSDADLRDTGEQGIEHDAASNEHTASSSIDLTRATHSEYNELALNSSESSSKNSSNADSVINNKSTSNTTINSATDADRLTQLGDSDFYYDEFGNQIRETGKGIKTRREYNAFNQLSCFNNNGTLTQYDYDPLGRRIAKHTEHGKIDYIWDNDQLIGECQHAEYTWYINLPNQFHPVALIKQGEVYYYHLDQLNTPRFVTNNKAEVVWENQADVYGYEEPEAEPDTNKENTFTQPIRFQGQYLDEESGLHYNRYRYYSPKQQRFINQDPIGLVGGINHYQYAPNPVNWVDPFGLTCKDGQKKNVFAGHGSIDVTKPAIVPMGTSLTVYSWDGATITDDLGSKIEDGTVSSSVFKKVYTEGDVIPGYMLHPNCGSLNISSNSIQVTESKHISELLAENMGEYHWAACTYIDGHENSNIIHDEEGIFKEESGQYSQLKSGKWEGLDENANDDRKRSKKNKKIKLNTLEKDQVKALLKEGVPIRAAIKHIKGQKITPRDFGTKSISENPQLNQMWNECILELTERSKAKAKKFFQSYQNLIDGTASKKEARYVFDEVNSLFKVKVNNAKEKGVIFEGYIFEQVHHWNWPIEKYSKQAISAENLFPTTAKLHAIIHNMTTSSSKKFVPFSYFHPISKIHERV